ncbi:MAG: carboxyl-terminal processing protease [Patiriisocius sp.]|jgi:carboxyl-terminal processing protease
MNQKSKTSVYFPIFLALAIAVGMLIGFGLSGNLPNNQLIPSRNSSNKFVQLVKYAEQEYVDTIDTEPLVEEAIQHFLQELDPHSYYLSKEQLADATEPLDGNFEGVGIEFRIQNDTLMVVNPVAGGPSEKVGILAGDRIVVVDGDSISGPELSNKLVMKLLKGPRNTKVDVTVVRKNAKKTFDFTITRGTIPINSLQVAYNIDANTGYIKISRFAEKTYDELLEALTKIRAQNLDNLILDLRNNGGGYLRTAISISDEFLRPEKMIVYTEGKAQDRQEYLSTRMGKLDDINLVVLINENSASASEIVAGAIQDNDRGTIIGRRSFGKGLVQEPIQFSDGTVVRLTIARYYTPTGRCIQKPYGEGIDYEDDYADRYNSGELFSEDSIAVGDTLKYYTPGGKVVYGGGGIMPDIFVPIDTSYTSDYFYAIAYQGLINQFAFDYSDKNRTSILKKYTYADDFVSGFEVDETLMSTFIDFTKGQDVTFDEEGYASSKNELKSRLKANIARDFWQDEGYYKCILKSDPVLLKTLEYFKNPAIANK